MARALAVSGAAARPELPAGARQGRRSGPAPRAASHAAVARFASDGGW